MFFVRGLYYRLVDRSRATCRSSSNFTGFGLYDRSVIDKLREIDDPYPYFRGLDLPTSATRAPRSRTRSRRRKRGITKNNFYTLYDLAMLGITNHSKVPLRLAAMAGFASRCSPCSSRSST